MAEKLASEEGRALYKRRRQTVAPVFGVIKAVLGFAGFSLRGLEKVEGEWTLVALAYNCKRLHKLSLATWRRLGGAGRDRASAPTPRTAAEAVNGLHRPETSADSARRPNHAATNSYPIDDPKSDRLLGKPRAGSGYRWTDPGSLRPHGVFLSAEASGSS